MQSQVYEYSSGKTLLLQHKFSLNSLTGWMIYHAWILNPKCLGPYWTVSIQVHFCHISQASNEEEILSFLISINVKDRSCDLFQMYIYLVLTENWLLSNPMFELKPVIYEMWGVYLRNCSCQITSTDMRPYASKVCC